MPQEIQALNEIGWGTVVTALFLLICALPTIWANVSKFVNLFGIETKWSLKKKADDELINELKVRSESSENDIAEIKEELKSIVSEFTKQFNELKLMMVNKDIDDKRSDILDFANAVQNNIEYNQEAYDHILFDIYPKYEKILEDNNMENGKVKMSIEWLQKHYAELLETGFKR